MLFEWSGSVASLDCEWVSSSIHFLEQPIFFRVHISVSWLLVCVSVGITFSSAAAKLLKTWGGRVFVRLDMQDHADFCSAPILGY